MSEETAPEATVVDQDAPEGADAEQTSTEEATLGDAGKKALDAMKAERNAAKRERDALRAKLDEIERANLSDLERAQQDAKDARDRLADLERQNVVQRVALEKGLPANLVDRLRGDTEDDISADADALLALVNAPRKPAPDPTQGGGGALPSTAQQFADAFEGVIH